MAAVMQHPTAVSDDTINWMGTFFAICIIAAVIIGVSQSSLFSDFAAPSDSPSNSSIYTTSIDTSMSNTGSIGVDCSRWWLASVKQCSKR